MKKIQPDFKFRAECRADVETFAGNLMRSHIMPVLTVTEIEPGLPDVEVFFENSIMTIEQIRYYMKKQKDSHVMIETLAPVHEYTGKRKPIMLYISTPFANYVDSSLKNLYMNPPEKLEQWEVDCLGQSLLWSTKENLGSRGLQRRIIGDWMHFVQVPSYSEQTWHIIAELFTHE